MDPELGGGLPSWEIVADEETEGPKVNVRSLLGRMVMPVLLGLATGPTPVGAAVAAQVAVPVDYSVLAPPRAAADEQVKYYIVGARVNGRPEYLFEIAAKTLGDGGRYLEIFRLNEGRLQPDGRYVEDPAVIEPGWTLILPPDASGPAVLVGLLSEITVPEPAQPNQGSGEAEIALPFSAEGVARATLLVGVTALMVVAVLVLLRGTQLMLPGRRSRHGGGRGAGTGRWRAGSRDRSRRSPRRWGGGR